MAHNPLNEDCPAPPGAALRTAESTRSLLVDSFSRLAAGFDRGWRGALPAKFPTHGAWKQGEINRRTLLIHCSGDKCRNQLRHVSWPIFRKKVAGIFEEVDILLGGLQTCVGERALVARAQEQKLIGELDWRRNWPLQMASIGEPVARRVVNHGSRGLGKLIAGVSNLIFPELLVSGGKEVQNTNKYPRMSCPSATLLQSAP